MDSIVKQLKQFKADAIYEKKKALQCAERKRVDIIEYYLLYKYF